MMLNAIYPIVEGHGEVASAPILLRRFAQEEFQNFHVVIFPAHRVPKGQMLSDSAQNLERAVELGARKIAVTGGTGAIFVLLDADDDCPAVIGPRILRRARATRADVFSVVIVARAEYEAWLLASARSLRGHCNVRQDADSPPDPEVIHDAKGYIERHLLSPGCYYSERVDQPAMTTRISFGEAEKCLSFQKLRRDLAAVFAL